MAEGLPRRGTEIARGLLKPLIEAIENGEHDEKTEWQRPGEMCSKTGGEQAHAVSHQSKTLSRTMSSISRIQCDAKRGNDGRYDETSHRGVETKSPSPCSCGERTGRGDRKHDGDSP